MMTRKRSPDERSSSYPANGIRIHLDLSFYLDDLLFLEDESGIYHLGLKAPS